MVLDLAEAKQYKLEKPSCSRMQKISGVYNDKMAIKNRSVTMGSKRTMSMEEFKRWIKIIDTDRDGRISQEELAEAIRSHGGWFSRWKGKRELRSADADGNGFIDESELSNLVEFAQKHLGVHVNCN